MKIVSKEEFEKFVREFGVPARPERSYTGKASCPTSMMVRHLTVKGEAVRFVTYKRGKEIDSSYQIPE